MNKSKLLITVLAFTMCFNMVNAQQRTGQADLNSLPLTVWIPDEMEGMPVTAKRNLENKLNQIVLTNGLLTGVDNSRFILTAHPVIMTKDVTSSAPPMKAYTIDVTFYIGDGFDGLAFSSYSTTVKGVGENETRAYMAALKNIKVNDPNYQSFIDKGKNKIVDYYNSQCDVIVREAQKLATMNQFDEAIWKLSYIPSQVVACYDKANDALLAIYQQKIDYECKIKVAEAKALWNANQSWEGAQKAGAILATIDPAANCFKEANALSESIAKRIREVDQREFNIEYETKVGLESDKINAIREIGVAYGKNQPNNVQYKALW